MLKNIPDLEEPKVEPRPPGVILLSQGREDIHSSLGAIAKADQASTEFRILIFDDFSQC